MAEDNQAKSSPAPITGEVIGLIICVLPFIYWLYTLGLPIFYYSQQQPIVGLDFLSFCLWPLNALLVIVLSVAAWKGRKELRRWYLRTTVVITLLVITFWPLMYGILIPWRDQVWQQAFTTVVNHSQPLISAINQYQAGHHGTPPPSLNALVPKYLSTIPGTGLRAFPAYCYRIDDNGAWALSVYCSRGLIDFSSYEYHPNQNDPAFSSRDAISRVGNWVYIRD
ncbi:MAG: hypothetical protein ACYDBB_11085 [Armatimonadota bacterium]